MREPRDPLLKVVLFVLADESATIHKKTRVCEERAGGRREADRLPERCTGFWCGRGDGRARDTASPPAQGEPPVRLDEHVNDPSAGSPTETLLRLLLPLNDQV